MPMRHELEMGKKYMIRELLENYVMVVDDKSRLEEWPDFFTDDGYYTVNTRSNFEGGFPMALMLDDNINKIRDRVTIIRELWKGHFDEQYPVHTLYNSNIRLIDEHNAEVTTNFNVTLMKLERGPYLLTGKYHDKIVFLPNGEPKFVERKVILTNEILPTYFVYPL